MNRNKNIKPNWYVVAFDDTRHWNIDPEDKPFIEKMVSVYMFDKNSHTYMCEMTPSYYLAHGYNTIYFKDSLYDSEEGDAIRERLDMKYIYSGSTDDEGTYMHVSDLDAYVKKHSRGRNKMVYHYGKVDAEDAAKEDRGEETVREYINGNCPF